MILILSLSRRAFLVAMGGAAPRRAYAPPVLEARHRSLAAFGARAAEPHHLAALEALAADAGAGEIGRRLAARALQAGVSAARAVELAGHLRAGSGNG